MFVGHMTMFWNVKNLSTLAFAFRYALKNNYY